MAEQDRNTESTSFPGMALPGGAAEMQGLACSMMRSNMEVVGLISKRTRAHMEFPKQAMTCRTAADMGQLGSEFWHDAIQDYVHCNQRLMALWVQSMSAFGQVGMARQAAEFANRVAAPMEKATEDAMGRMADDPAEPWAWWRTDAKGARTLPRTAGVQQPAGEPRSPGTTSH